MRVCSCFRAFREMWFRVFSAHNQSTRPLLGFVMQTFFTSDTHFDDEYAIQYFNRPFKSVDEMNTVMVEKWNSIIGDNDIVYHLGDFTLDDIHHFTKWASQLNGNIKILPGSHDGPWLKDFVPSEKVQVIAPLVSAEFPEVMIDEHPQHIVMCHYSMQVWDRSNHGSWHLFGHSHGKQKGIGLSFDVGVDCTNFVPLSLEEVATKMAHLT
jgi:calcineurin-like phosphoesterase family protein